jgi:hypothetical protein
MNGLSEIGSVPTPHPVKSSEPPGGLGSAAVISNGVWSVAQTAPYALPNTLAAPAAAPYLNTSRRVILLFFDIVLLPLAAV